MTSLYNLLTLPVLLTILIMDSDLLLRMGDSMRSLRKEVLLILPSSLRVRMMMNLFILWLKDNSVGMRR